MEIKRKKFVYIGASYDKRTWKVTGEKKIRILRLIKKYMNDIVIISYFNVPRINLHFKPYKIFLLAPISPELTCSSLATNATSCLANTTDFLFVWTV